ncbi:hypothetical protein [Acanthopleuribacter pedis]|uniref:Uncharacterized protein n=1 Tax=Acanthopleuribacter pedis TaxID=442870 RepID=A0A8J7QE22_9BACT|nr:hypothetical protein [Acanthopleuribacter pedis]MBO1322464.1 hypothetical protein [Acanthopleuribacter pedis]
MPIEYHCKACFLSFAVGWEHFFDLSEGYGSVTYLVCSACGTWHRRLHALADRGPPSFTYYDVLLMGYEPRWKVILMKQLRTMFGFNLAEIRQKVANLPLVLATKVSKAGWRDLNPDFVGEVHFEPLPPQPNPVYGPIQSDRLETWSKPLISEAGSYSQLVENDAMDALKQLDVHLENPWSPMSVLGPTKGLNRHFELANQACSHCRVVGALSSDWPENKQTCPACRRDALEFMLGWIT